MSEMNTRDEYVALFEEPPASLSTRFPHVPPPSSPYSPEILAARWIGRQLRPEDLLKTAANLLEMGLDTPGLRRLSAESQLTGSADAEPLIARVFRELGVAYPLTLHEARQISKMQVAREVIAGQRNAWTAASHLVMTWDREESDPDMWQLDELLDAIDIDPGYRPTPESLTEELHQLFAKMASSRDKLD